MTPFPTNKSSAPFTHPLISMQVGFTQKKKFYLRTLYYRLSKNAVYISISICRQGLLGKKIKKI